MYSFRNILSLLCLGFALESQAQNLTINGTVELPDGYTAGLCCHTDTSYSVMIGETVIKDGRFCLTGTIDHPLQGTLMTNNLAIVDQNKWPVDSVKWTYNEVFVSEGTLTFSPDYVLTGSQVQTDYNEWLAINGEAPVDDGPESKAWGFIDAHPQSVVSVWLANDMLKRGYNLTKEQVAHLEQAITAVPLDTMRMNEFRQRIAYAKKTTVGGDLLNLELLDTNGKICQLVDVVPKGVYVLVDFWASWCGICLASMPEIAKIADEYKGKFSVVGISIDKKDAPWRAAMKKHPENWPQYITTEQGYKDLFVKYQVGNGVPYYLMVTPDGKVLNSPSTPDAVREVLEKYN